MASDLSIALSAAIENAYAVFGRYSCPEHIDVCEQCYPELPEIFAKTPLREITADLLSSYCDARACCGYSVNMDDDMRYLLPRWLELVAQGHDIGRWGEEDGLTVMTHAEWRTRWPAVETAALDRYFAALFCDSALAPLRLGDGGLLRSVNGRDFPWFLWTVASAGSDAALAPLQLAETMTGRDVDLRIAGLAFNSASDAVYGWARKRDDGSAELFDADLAVLSTDETLGASCDCNRCTQRRAAWEWLAKPAFRERLEAATLAESDPNWAQILSFGEQIVGALVRNRTGSRG